MTYTVWRLEWEERERGWGVRPDGYSLHLTRDDVLAYVDYYWEHMPDLVPDIYCSPSGPPKEVEVTDDEYKHLIIDISEEEGERGRRCY